jgi:hypothetical protein
MVPIETCMDHIDAVLQMIHDVSRSDIYASSYVKDKENVYNIQVCKKDEGHKLDESSVTPTFPLRIQLHRKKCIGVLCSPLTRAPPRNVRIENLECMTDFLLLHLSFGCNVARTMIYITKAMPDIPMMRIDVEAVPNIGFVFRYAARAVIMQVNPDMSTTLSYGGEVIDAPIAGAHTSAGLGDVHKEEKEDAYFEHCFCDIAEHDVISGKCIKIQHPRTKQQCAAIAEALLLLS